MVTKKSLSIYREFKTVTVLNDSVKFVELSLPQIGLFMDYIVKAFSEEVAVTGLSKEEIFKRVLKTISDTFTSTAISDQEKTELFSKLFLSPDANQLLFQLVKETFPEIQNPELLKMDALVDILQHFFVDFSKMFETGHS